MHDRVQRGPVRPGLLPAARTTPAATALFAALNIATGKMTATCQSRHRHQEFLTFLKQMG